MRPTHLLLCVLLTVTSFAQDSTDYAQPRTPKEPRRPFKDRLYFGGGLGLSFGTVTSIQIEPLVGVNLDEKNKLSTGLGLNYWYYRDNRFSPAIELNGYGYRSFLRYRFIPQAFAHAEFLHMNVERYDLAGEKVRIWVPHLLVGGGYVQPIGDHSSLYIQVLWEVLQDPNSVYRDQGPIISGGVGIGF